MRVWPFALLCVGCHPCGLWRGPLEFPDAAARHVPLNVEWEWPLYIWSGGSPAPMPVIDIKAACVPTDACDATITIPRDPDFADPPRLAVAGKREGSATVELDYTHPKSNEHLHATLHFVFVPAEHLHELAIGDPAPSEPFVYAFHNDLLRCEPWGTQFDCYAREHDLFQCNGSGCGETNATTLDLFVDVANGRVTGTTLKDRGDNTLQRTP